jgi:hypothetical protein
VTNQKLISILQSRIAKNKQHITSWWIDYHMCRQDNVEDRKFFKKYAIELGVQQKQDKAIMKALIAAEKAHSRVIRLAVRNYFLEQKLCEFEEE